MSADAVIAGSLGLTSLGLIAFFYHQAFVRGEQSSLNFARIGLIAILVLVAVFAIRIFALITTVWLKDMFNPPVPPGLPVVITRWSTSLIQLLSLVTQGCLLGILAPRNSRALAFLLAAVMILPFPGFIIQILQSFIMTDPFPHVAEQIAYAGIYLTAYVSMAAFGLLFHLNRELRGQSVLLGPAWIAEGLFSAVSVVAHLVPRLFHGEELSGTISVYLGILITPPTILNMFGLILFFLAARRKEDKV